MKAAIIGAALVLGMPSAARAQPQQGNAATAQAQLKARSNLSIMEGVLERAVVLGANSLNRRVRAVAPQDVQLLAGDEPEVRGFRLDGYGVFFDVEVPVLRQSVAWSLRALMDQSGVPLSVAVQQLRAYVHSIQDPRARQPLEQALRRIEMQVGAPAAQAASQTPNAALAWLNDPNAAYTSEVKAALIDAMLEHSGALGIGADEWLTVAARDNEHRDRLNPGDDLSAIILRIKGSDLAALRAGRISADEARTRLDIKEY